MRHRPFSLLALLSVATLFVGLTAVGCNSCDGVDNQPEPWKFADDEASYEIIFPGKWAAEPPESINPHAEVAASLDDTYFFFVTSEKLPSFGERDVFYVKEKGLTMLDEAVDNLVIERQGPIELDDVSGLTVFASGSTQNEDFSYITSYAVHDGYGYQIIGLADEQHSSTLFDEVDTILARWRFIDEQTVSDQEESGQPEEASQPGPLEEAEGDSEVVHEDSD